jgi:hypothetical protein
MKSAYPHESEVLLPRGSKLVIVSDDMQPNGQRVVKARVVLSGENR